MRSKSNLFSTARSRASSASRTCEAALLSSVDDMAYAFSLMRAYLASRAVTMASHASLGEAPSAVKRMAVSSPEWQGSWPFLKHVSSM